MTTLMLLTACNSESAPVGGVSANEARALDEAAEMIESRRLPPGALRPPTAAPESSQP